MNSKKIQVILCILTIFFIVSCLPKSANSDKANGSRIVKGLYTCSDDFKSFTDCEDGREYGVLDSIGNLESNYSKFKFDKPNEPVYIEAECHVIKPDSLVISSNFDSVMVVTKLLKISKVIPDGPCSQ